jgi:serine/threonine protein kinase
MRLWRYGREIEQLGQRYRLDGALGSGGMADVCLAWDERDEREVAIKVIKPDVLDQRSLDRFLKEAGQVANWQHPNILRIYSDLKLELLDAAQGAIVPYIVMEYAQGGDLQKRMTSGQPYPLAETLEIFAQLCSAVAYAHAHGIIHRDLKPLNILFRELPNGAEQVVLSDFGLAVEMDATHHTFARGGTLPYMAPEQLLKGRVEAASDIFALGVILYQLCTGHLPFRRTLLDLRRADAFALPAPPSSLEPELPAALDEAILTALNEDPAARYPDAEQFWHAVQESISSLQTSTRDRSQPIARSGRQARNPYSTRILRDSSPYSTEPRHTSHPTQSDPKSLTGRASRSRRDGIASSGRSTLDSHPAASRHFQTRILPPDSSPGSPSHHSYGSFGLPDPNATPVMSEPDIDTDAEAGGIVGGRVTRGGNGMNGGNVGGNATHPPNDVGARFISPSRPTPPSGSINPFGGGVGRGNGGGRNGLVNRAPTSLGGWVGLPVRVGMLVAVVLLLAGGLVYFVPGMRDRLIPGASVTVLITPASQSVQRSYTVPANNVSARQVTSSQAQSQVAQASGHRQIQATQAKGQLTFFNSAFVAQQIPAGTTVTGKDGVQVKTDANANIPPDNSNTGAVGKVSVPAHSTNAGAKGNIAVLDLDQTCCIPNNPVFVRNLNAFTGGQDAQNYAFVQQGDVDAVANPLVKTLTKQGQNAVQGRLNAGEQIAGAPQCTPNVATDPQHPVGDTGVNVASTTVNVTVQCSAEAYNTSQLQGQVAGQQQGAASPAPNYSPAGSSIGRVTVQGPNLLVNAATTWIYQIDRGQQQRMAQSIVGMTAAAATRQLASAPGVRNVVIQGLSAASQLPGDPTRISIVIQPIGKS